MRRFFLTGLLAVFVLAMAASPIGAVSSPRTAETAYPKKCGHAFYMGYSLNARTSCALVERANGRLATRTIQPNEHFKIWLNQGRLRLLCHSWGGVDGLGVIGCRNPEHGFAMRFRRVG